MSRIMLYVVGLLTMLAGCGDLYTGSQDRAQGASANLHVPKPISFAILEDYDKGQDLREIERDFALMKELEIDTLRCSFGWDDYEPEPGQYDFAWLKQFAEAARRHGPYVFGGSAHPAPWPLRDS